MAFARVYTRCFSVLAEKQAQHYDCIISGGGMIGSTLACSLASAPLLKNRKILLIEAGPKKEWSLTPHYSNRVSALNNSTKALFEKIGMWKNIESARYQKVEDIKVWGYCSSNSTQFADVGDKDIAYIVENDVIMNAGYKQLKSVNNVDVLYDTQVTEVDLPKGENPTGLAQIKLQDNTVYRCHLLVGADGANSKVRSSMDPHYLCWSYRQSAVVATLNILCDDHNTTAWQRFLPEGPIAILPLTKNMSSLVWSTTLEKANYLLELPNEEFVNAVNDALVFPSKKDSVIELSGNALNTVLNALSFNTSSDGMNPPFVKAVESNSRAAFPLGFGHCSKYAAPKVVLVGDAAHKVHPLAGQGVNLGFSDIHYLSTALTEGVRQGRHFGDFSDLITYERTSQWHNVPVMLAIDLLHRVYVSDIGVVKVIGDACFKIAQSVRPIKSTMKTFASG